MIYRLIEAGADPNTADYNGDTPLIKAIWMTSSSTIEKNEITNICIKLIQAGRGKFVFIKKLNRFLESTFMNK
jgi:hypothetical protein